MPEHMKRREAVYYFRHVLPKDLQAALGRRETCRSLKTIDFAEAKRRLHRENLRFDEWVRAERARLVNTRQMAAADESGRPSVAAAAMEEYSREADDFFKQLYGHDDEEGLPFDQWVLERKQAERPVDAAFLAEKRRMRAVPLRGLFDDYSSSCRLAGTTAKRWRAVVDHLINFLGHDNALRLRASDLRRWRDELAKEQLQLVVSTRTRQSESPADMIWTPSPLRGWLTIACSRNFAVKRL